MGLPNIILDPAEVAITGRVEIPLEGGGIRTFNEGLDFGDQEIKAFMAEGTFGSQVIDNTWPLRTIKIPLVIREAPGVSFDEQRAKLEAWVSAVNTDGGGWLKRILPSGRHFFADIVEAKLRLSTDWLAENRNVDRQATLELQALPDFYGDEVIEAAVEGTGDVSQTLKVKGTLPARVTSLKVEDKSAHEQYGLAYHLRCRNYSSATTAKWAYEAEELTPLDLATEIELTGASGGRAIRHNNLAPNWTPVLSTNLKAGTYLTHQGVYNVWARVFSTSSSLPWVRLLWDLGDIVAPSENTQIRVPGTNGFFLVNLGQITLRGVPFGEQRWQGIIQARGEAGGENLSIDRLRFLCADEGSGVLRGTPAVTSPVGATFQVRDEFNQEAGKATGKSAAIGGVYSAVAGSDTDDFEIDASHRLRRTTKNDSGTIGGVSLPGRGIGVPVEPTNLVFTFDFSAEGELTNEFRIGQILSYVNSSNFVLAYLTFTRNPGKAVEVCVVRADGVVLGKRYAPPGLSTYASPKGSLLTMVRGRQLQIFTAAEGGVFESALSVEDAMIGVKGRAYLYDQNVGSITGVRWYDNLGIWIPQNDPVIYSSRTARLTSEGMFRASEDGKSSGMVAYPAGDLLRLPVAGSGERVLEIAAKASRGDFENLSDSGLDKVAMQLSYRPCWAQVPSF
jgi:hypothetical protein